MNIQKWFEFLPKLRTKIQLLGLIVFAATFVATQLIEPEYLKGAICVGAMGVFFIIFGFVFQYIGTFPPKERSKLIMFLATLFVILVLSMLALATVYTLQAIKTSTNSHHRDQVIRGSAGSNMLKDQQNASKKDPSSQPTRNESPRESIQSTAPDLYIPKEKESDAIPNKSSEFASRNGTRIVASKEIDTCPRTWENAGVNKFSFAAYEQDLAFIYPPKLNISALYTSVRIGNAHTILVDSCQTGGNKPEYRIRKIECIFLDRVWCYYADEMCNGDHSGCKMRLSVYCDKPGTHILYITSFNEAGSSVLNRLSLTFTE